MHIQVDIRGYDHESEAIYEVQKRIKTFIQSLTEELELDEEFYPNIDENDEIMDTTGWHIHTYPYDNPEDYKYFGCMPYDYESEEDTERTGTNVSIQV